MALEVLPIALDMDSATPVKMLWKHPHPELTRTYLFKAHVEQKYDVHLPEYDHLRQWSLDNLSCFWEEVWAFTNIQASMPFAKVVCCREITRQSPLLKMLGC